MIYKLNEQIDHALRQARRTAVAAGGLPEFHTGTADIRQAEWTVTPRGGTEIGEPHYLTGVQGAGEAAAWASSRPRDAAAVVLWIDSVWGAFEVEEILYALKDSVCRVEIDVDGYLYSIIETFHAFPEFVLPDRADIVPGLHMLSSLRRLVGDVCRRRGLDTGVAAADSWPGGIRVEAADLLLVPRGRITERGMRQNIRVALGYLDRARADAPGDDEAALRHRSAAMLAAAQLWQWVTHETGVLAEGRIVTGELFDSLLVEEVGQEPTAGPGAVATKALRDTVLSKSFTMLAVCEPPGSGEGDQ